MQVQAVNDAGNLVFFVFILAILALAAAITYRKLRRRSAQKLVLALVGCAFAYAVILMVVSLSSKTRQLALGTDKCFDDWCASVLGAHSVPGASNTEGSKSVAVALRISNLARGAAFRPSQPRVMLVLPSGELVSSSVSALRGFEKQAGPQEDIAKRLVAGESFQTTVVFEVPSATSNASVQLLEGPSLITRLLVGDENSFFHKKSVYPVIGLN
jgi:hypothetical protein